MIAGYNTVWFFPKAEYAYKVQYDFSKGYGEGQAHFSWEKVRMHEAPMGTVFASDTGFFYIDGNGRLYHHNQNTQTVDYIASVSGMVQDYDVISGITRLDDDILVSVAPLGVLRLIAANGYKGEYNYNARLPPAYSLGRYGRSRTAEVCGERFTHIHNTLVGCRQTVETDQNFLYGYR